MSQHLTIYKAQVQVRCNIQYMRTILRHGIDYNVSNTKPPNENPGKGSIHNIKLWLYRYKHKYNTPMQLWGLILDYTCEISLSSPIAHNTMMVQ